MRNFHHVSKPNFTSYNINYGEYVSDGPSIAEVLHALSLAFETPYKKVGDAWLEVLQGSESSAFIAPSEYEVLVALYEFSRFVDHSIASNELFGDSRAFSYVNLNTGKSVVWVHFVC